MFNRIKLSLTQNKASSLIIALILIIGIIGLAFYFSPQQSRERASASNQPDITLLRKEGEIYYKPTQASNYENITESKKSISINSTVKTFNAVGYVLFDEYSFHRLDSNSEIELKDIDAGVHVVQKLGRVLHSFNPDNKVLNKEYKVDTPDVSATVRGTSFEIQVVKNDDGSYATTIEVVEGTVETKINSTGEIKELTKGEKLEKAADGTYATETFSVDDTFSPETLDLIHSTKSNGYVFDDAHVEDLLNLDQIVKATDTLGTVGGVVSDASDLARKQLEALGLVLPQTSVLNKLQGNILPPEDSSSTTLNLKLPVTKPIEQTIDNTVNNTPVIDTVVPPVTDTTNDTTKTVCQTTQIIDQSLPCVDPCVINCPIKPETTDGDNDNTTTQPINLPTLPVVTDINTNR